MNKGIVAGGAALLAIGVSACASTVTPSPTPSLSGPKLYAVGKAMTNGAHQRVTVTAFAQGWPLERTRRQAREISASASRSHCSTGTHHRGSSRSMN